MDEITRDYIQTYIQGLIKDEEDELEKFRAHCIENHRPIIQKEVGQFIKVMLNIIKPKKILEVGTNVGFSSIKVMNFSCITFNCFNRPFVALLISSLRYFTSITELVRSFITLY